MSIIEILGYIGALLVGLVLGLIGGGGSILTVPVLVYFFYLNPVTATAYSLFVVGSSALVGALRNMQKNLVVFKTAFVFAGPALVMVFVTRKFIIPAIPEQLFSIGGLLITKSLAIMVFFAIIMLLASVTMIRNRKPEKEQVALNPANHALLVIQGIVIGFITGMVGAGGGFLIIPALVILAKLPMKKAVATSLFIIAINSLIGFTGDISNIMIDWSFLFLFTALSIIGIFIGIWLNKFFDGKRLKKAFGWFVLVMGIYVIYKELFS